MICWSLGKSNVDSGKKWRIELKLNLKLEAANSSQTSRHLLPSLWCNDSPERTYSMVVRSCWSLKTNKEFLMELWTSLATIDEVGGLFSKRPLRSIFRNSPSNFVRIYCMISILQFIHKLRGYNIWSGIIFIEIHYRLTYHSMLVCYSIWRRHPAKRYIIINVGASCSVGGERKPTWLIHQ